jgi:hypothetical protein
MQECPLSGWPHLLHLLMNVATCPPDRFMIVPPALIRLAFCILCHRLRTDVAVRLCNILAISFHLLPIILLTETINRSSSGVQCLCFSDGGSDALYRARNDAPFVRDAFVRELRELREVRELRELREVREVFRIFVQKDHFFFRQPKPERYRPTRSRCCRSRTRSPR